MVSQAMIALGMAGKSIGMFHRPPHRRSRAAPPIPQAPVKPCAGSLPTILILPLRCRKCIRPAGLLAHECFFLGYGVLGRIIDMSNVALHQSEDDLGELERVLTSSWSQFITQPQNMITRSGLAFLEEQAESGNYHSSESGALPGYCAAAPHNVNPSLGYSAIRICVSIPPNNARAGHAGEAAKPEAGDNHTMLPARDKKADVADLGSKPCENKESECARRRGIITRLRARRLKLLPSIKDVLGPRKRLRSTSTDKRRPKSKSKDRIRAEGGPKRWGRDEVDDGWGLAAARRSDEPIMKILCRMYDEKEAQKIRGNRRYNRP